MIGSRHFTVLGGFCLALTLLIAGFHACAGAQGATAQADPFAPITPRLHVRGLFWKIEGAGVRASYLLGTMHAADPAVVNLPAVVMRAFKKADSVCTEVKMDSAAMAAEMRGMFFHDGRTLRAVAGERLYARTLEVARQLSVPEELLVNMKPWAAAYMLSLPGNPNATFLDLKLYLDALRQGKDVCGLETAEEHGKLFDSLPMADQLYTLRQTVTHMPEMKRMYRRLHDAYVARDLTALVRESRDTPWVVNTRVAAKFVRRFILDRNRIMLKRMQPHLKRGNAFFAVGALHLTGEMGLLRLLEKQGYRVTALY